MCVIRCLIPTIDLVTDVMMTVSPLSLGGSFIEIGRIGICLLPLMYIHTYVSPTLCRNQAIDGMLSLCSARTGKESLLRPP